MMLLTLTRAGGDANRHSDGDGDFAMMIGAWLQIFHSLFGIPRLFMNLDPKRSLNRLQHR